MLSSMRTITLALTILTGLDSAVPVMAANAGYAFVDVTVVPMDREVLLPHRTVLVSSGKIVSIAPATSKLPKGTRLVRGSGRYLLPGLARRPIRWGMAGSLKSDQRPRAWRPDGRRHGMRRVQSFSCSPCFASVGTPVAWRKASGIRSRL